MRKSPILLSVLSLLIITLAFWLTAEGLSARFTGSYLTEDSLWQTVSASAGLSPETLYWPLVWLGLTWIGVLMAVWTGSSWRNQAVLAASVVSLLFLGWGTVLAACVLVCALLPQGRKLLRSEDA